MSCTEFHNVKEFEEYAKQSLPVDVLGYINSAAGEQFTMKNNCDAFKRILIRPRTLCDGSGHIDTSTTLLGHKVNSPISLANAGNQKVAHPDGEIATAKAAAAAGVCMAVSTFTTTSPEEITEHEPDLLKWFQLTFHHDRRVSEDLVRRAEKAGYKAIIFAGDPSVVGETFHFELPTHLSHSVYEPYHGKSNADNFLSKHATSNVTWKDAVWLRSITKLPIILKGVMSAEDAELAVHHGVDAVWLSNWGGRRGDGIPATIDVLQEVVRAVNGRAEVYLDSGIRSGSDAFKAIAWGARAVFVGRPIFWALSTGGEPGVKKLLDILDDELKAAMKLTGSRRISDIKPSRIMRQSFL